MLARQGQEYSGHEAQFALRGGVIGVGTAHVGIATHTLSAADSCLYRAMEFRGGRPLRRQGPPPEDYVERLQARATQPAVGSYRFSVRLVEPPQRVLFPESEDSVTPESIAAFVVDFVNAVNAGSDDGLTALVPDLSYRSADRPMVFFLPASELPIMYTQSGNFASEADKRQMRVEAEAGIVFVERYRSLEFIPYPHDELLAALRTWVKARS